MGVNYIEQGTNILRNGLGPLRNKVPLGRNATFSFSYTSGKTNALIYIFICLFWALIMRRNILGTIEKLIVYNVTNGVNSSLGDFIVTDKFLANEFLVHILFEMVGIKKWYF